MGRLRFRWLALRVAPVGAVAVLLASGCGLLPAVLGATAFRLARHGPAVRHGPFSDVTLRPSVQQALYARDVFNFYADQTAPGGSLNQLPTNRAARHRFPLKKSWCTFLTGEVAHPLGGPIQ